MNETVSFARNSVNVFFHILTACNLNCRHCYINPRQHGRRTLPLPTIKKWLAAFPDRRQEANVIFLGGEPTLHPDLPQAVRCARELGYGSVTIDTNGYLFHDFLDRVQPGDVDYLSFSLDGATREVNDRLRGKGCYEHCLAGIQRAVGKGFATSLIYTVSRENIHELPAMAPLARDMGIKRFFIQVIGLRGNSADAAEPWQVSRDEWLEAVPPAAAAAAEMGIAVTYPKVYLDPGEEFECAGLVAENYFLFPNGRVYRCPICEDFPLNSLRFAKGRLVATPPVNEMDLFQLRIPEGCVMNRLIQPGNIDYDRAGNPSFQVACCLLKEEIAAAGR